MKIIRYRFIGVLLFAISSLVFGQDFSWQEPHAKVLPTGDLEWAPEGYDFNVKGAPAYIDFEGGDDNNDGLAKETAWKHHPWDPAATGRAKQGKADSYIFKGGVTYRGKVLLPKNASAVFTRDPSWGEGEAVWLGSEAVSGWTKGAHPDMPDATGVWKTTVDFLPRCVWMVDGEGQVTRINLARSPNWTVTDPNNVLSEWYTWVQPEWWKAFGGNDVNTMVVDGKKFYLGVDKPTLSQFGEDVMGGVVWTEFGIPTGNVPTPCKIQAYDSDKGGIAFGSMWNESHGGATCMIFAGHRYYLEDRPHYLDTGGEFWFDRQGKGGTLYVRLPDDADPNAVRIEAGKYVSLIDGTESGSIKNLEVSGLTFRFMNVNWEYYTPQYMDGDQRTGVIRVKAAAEKIDVHHNTFEHVNSALWVEAIPFGGERNNPQAMSNVVEYVRFADNRVRDTDNESIYVGAMRRGPAKPPRPEVHTVEILRNKMDHIGFRASRGRWSQGIEVSGVRDYHIAGNMVERMAGAGIFASLAKGDGHRGDWPFARGLIHHNKAVDTLLQLSDFGGIQANDNGPAYLWSNISGNPGGLMYWQWKPDKKEGSPRFGHAYYFDGNVMKRHMFNNIAWGANNELGSIYANRAATQQVCGMNVDIFNNTFYKFVEMIRKQSIQGARFKHIGNLLVDSSEFLFHDNEVPKKAAVNAPHLFDAEEALDYATIAYRGNVMFDIEGSMGIFEQEGHVYETLEDMQAALKKRGAWASDVGQFASAQPLPSAGQQDFRPAESAAAAGRAYKVFVPWALHGVVGEWPFHINNEDPTLIIDEHNFLTDEYFMRKQYYKRPYYPLKGVNVGEENYVQGILEDWTRSAIRLNGEDEYLELPLESLNETLTFDLGKRGGGVLTVKPEDRRTVRVDQSSFLVEAIFKVNEKDNGSLVQLAGGKAGYGLQVLEDGKLKFSMADGKAGEASRVSSVAVNDGEWHHVIAEADRSGKGDLHIYVDGKLAEGAFEGTVGTASMYEHDESLEVGKGLNCTIDFLRVAQGTLAQAQTSIEELYEWEFNGPFLDDFAGRKRTFEKSAPGAIDLAE